MSEKLGTDSPEIRLPERSIRSINKKMVSVAFLTAILAVFVVIYLIPSSPSSDSSKKPVLATFMEGRKFPELQQLPESYDDVEPGNPGAVLGPIDSQFNELAAPSESRASQTIQGEQEAAHKSTVLFASEQQRHVASDPIVFAPPTNPKSNLLFNQKEQFLQGGGHAGPSSLQRTGSPYAVLQGTLIPAVLLSAVNSDLPGPVLAQVTDNIYPPCRKTPSFMTRI